MCDDALLTWGSIPRMMAAKIGQLSPVPYKNYECIVALENSHAPAGGLKHVARTNPWPALTLA